jgi:hypothetical protein
MPPLRHDTLKPEIAGVQENQRAVLLIEVLVVPQAGSRTRQQTLKCGGLSHRKWIPTKIVAVKLDQIEGVQKYLSVMAAVSDAIEGRDPVSSGHTVSSMTLAALPAGKQEENARSRTDSKCCARPRSLCLAPC